MSDMREKLADVVKHILNECDSEYIEAELADAIIAALPGMVKPLVWVRHPIGWSCEGFMIDTRNGFYVMRGLYGKPRFDTLEDAQAACNAHHVARTMQAFDAVIDGGKP